MEQRRYREIRRGKVLSVVCCNKTGWLKCHQRDVEFSEFLIWEKKVTAGVFNLFKVIL